LEIEREKHIKKGLRLGFKKSHRIPDL